MYAPDTVAVDGHRLCHAQSGQPGVPCRGRDLLAAGGRRAFRVATTERSDRQYGHNVGLFNDRGRGGRYRSHLRRVQQSNKLPYSRLVGDFQNQDFNDSPGITAIVYITLYKS